MENVIGDEDDGDVGEEEDQVSEVHVEVPNAVDLNEE